KLSDRLVRVEPAAPPVDATVPAVHAVAGYFDGPFVKRLGFVVELRKVKVADVAHPFAAGAHAAKTLESRLLGLGFTRAALHGDGAARPHRGDVKRERVGRADVRLPDPAKEDAQQGVGVRRRP